MHRDVDLVSYLPPFLQTYKEQTATLTAANPEFSLVWNAVDRVLKNMFIETADEYGISHFEKMLNITPAVEASLELRRTKVKTRWLNKLPYTVNMLNSKLIELYGEGTFSISANGYELSVVLYFQLEGQEGQLEDLAQMIAGMVPAGVAASVIYEKGFTGSIYVGGRMSTAEVTTLRQVVN